MRKIRIQQKSVYLIIGALSLSLLVCACGSSRPKSSGNTAPAPDSTGPSIGFIGKHQSINKVASTVSKSGDVNPYAVAVIPETPSTGPLKMGNVLVDNFNSKSNLQGTGTSILQISPTGSVSTFAQLSPTQKGCIGGIGLDTGMFIFRSGYVIVGSVPTTMGTTGTAGPGCLVLLSPNGSVASTISGVDIDGPWDMSGVTNGDKATLLVSNSLVTLSGETLPPVTRGNIVRITFVLSPNKAPKPVSRFIIATGFSEQASASAFLIGPTGIAIKTTTAYVANPLQNDIVTIPDALTRTSVATVKKVLAKGDYLRQPLGLALAPNGDILAANGGDGDIVEISTSGKEVTAFPVDTDKRQSPPGSGDIFGLAPTKTGVYFVKDDTNSLAFLKVGH